MKRTMSSGRPPPEDSPDTTSCNSCTSSQSRRPARPAGRGPRTRSSPSPPSRSRRSRPLGHQLSSSRCWGRWHRSRRRARRIEATRREKPGRAGFVAVTTMSCSPASRWVSACFRLHAGGKNSSGSLGPAVGDDALESWATPRGSRRPASRLPPAAEDAECVAPSCRPGASPPPRSRRPTEVPGLVGLDAPPPPRPCRCRTA